MATRSDWLGFGAAALVSLTLLAGCESVDDKVDRLYEQSQELAAAGDTDRALVTLAKIFDLDGHHRDARMLYANLQLERKDYRAAYRHFLLLAEQYPDDLPARTELTRLAILSGQWDEARRHAGAAARIAPEDAEVRKLQDAVAYEDLKNGDDAAALTALIAEVEQTVAEDPRDLIARRILIDHAVESGDAYAAIDEARAALALAPENRELNQILLSLLAGVEDSAGLGEQLKLMVERFPEDREIRTALVRWYLAAGDPEAAEAFVRQLVAEAGDEIPPRVALVQFLRDVRGPDAAIAETRKLIEEGHADTMFRTLLASLQFDSGARDEAIADLSALVGEAGTDEDGLTARITLAQMYNATGKREQAEPLVDAVLAADNRNVDALKLKALWLIADDRVRDAVLALRTALDQDPRDPQAMTLLARAYERDGNSELMGESLGRAYEASNAAPEESLRYALFLVQNDKLLTAEDVLVKSLRLSPGNIPIMRTLAGIYLELADWPRTEQIVSNLRELGTGESDLVATELEAVLLQRMQRTDESITLLRNVIEEGKGGLATQAAIIRTHLANGDVTNARAYMNELLADSEGSDQRDNILFLNAALLAVEGRQDAAEKQYRELLARNPEAEIIWRALIASTVRAGDMQQAQAVADEALAVLPDSPTLLWIRAGFAENRGDIEEAIAIYERLYDQDSRSAIVANNLASLITTYRDDQDSLERAYVIARRLRGARIPAFQETFGWIAYRLGNYQEALDYLEPAARGLAGNPVVRYHLAKTYDALGRGGDADREYRAALELWGDAEGAMPEDARESLAATGDAAPPATATHEAVQ